MTMKTRRDSAGELRGQRLGGGDRRSRSWRWIGLGALWLVSSTLPVWGQVAAIGATPPPIAPTAQMPNPSPNPTPALFRRSTVLPSGTAIPTRYRGEQGEAERLVVMPDETAQITLTVRQAVTRDGAIVIPAGSTIAGTLEPSGEQRVQFLARDLTLPDGRTQAINAQSGPIGRPETLREGASTRQILTGAAIGAGAATVLSEIFGRIDLWEVLAGAGAGAVGGLLTGRRSVDVVVVEATDLELTLRSPLEVAR